jgi:hypothetical protein
MGTGTITIQCERARPEFGFVVHLNMILRLRQVGLPSILKCKRLRSGHEPM